jgi:hypothetical protein
MVSIFRTENQMCNTSQLLDLVRQHFSCSTNYAVVAVLDTHRFQPCICCLCSKSSFDVTYRNGSGIRKRNVTARRSEILIHAWKRDNARSGKRWSNDDLQVTCSLPRRFINSLLVYAV